MLRDPPLLTLTKAQPPDFLELAERKRPGSAGQRPPGSYCWPLPRAQQLSLKPRPRSVWTSCAKPGRSSAAPQ